MNGVPGLFLEPAHHGAGEVLTGPPGPEDGFEAIRLHVSSGETLTQYRSRENLIADYAEGMPLLVLYLEEGRRIFYLDRAVLLRAGTLFSIVPLGPDCAADLYTRPGAPAVQTGEIPSDFLSGSVSQLQFSQIVTFFYQETASDFYFRGERHGVGTGGAFADFIEITDRFHRSSSVVLHLGQRLAREWRAAASSYRIL